MWQNIYQFVCFINYIELQIVHANINLFNIVNPFSKGNKKDSLLSVI